MGQDRAVLAGLRITYGFSETSSLAREITGKEASSDHDDGGWSIEEGGREGVR
jgi:hypothetical protein